MALSEMNYVEGGVQIKKGSISISTSGEHYITCGFKPKYIAVVYQGSGSVSSHGNGCCRLIYDEDYSPDYTYSGNKGNSGAETISTLGISATSGANQIIHVDSNGFSIFLAGSQTSLMGTYHYFAVG